MKKEHITPAVDIVDHENKTIKEAEDFVKHEGNVEKTAENEAADTMRLEKKQVSAEIYRNDFADELKDKGC